LQGAVVTLFQSAIPSHHLQHVRKQKKAAREEKRKKAAMEGVLCTENRIWDHRIRGRSANHYTASFVTWLPVQSYRSKKGPPSFCTTLQHGTGVWKRVRSLSPYTVLESSAPRKEPHNLVTTSRSDGLPSHDFRVMLHANKTPDSSVSRVTRLRWHYRGSGGISRRWGQIFLF
jgi:hypothetical protein